MSASVKSPSRTPEPEQLPVMKDERDFRRFIIQKLEDQQTHISYIESHETSAGIPDLNIFIQGKDVWVELKVLSDLKKPKMRPTQKRWHVDRWNNGGWSWVIALDLDQMSLIVIPGHIAAGLTPNPGTWRSMGATHPATDIIPVIRSMARRIKNGPYQ